MRLRESAAASVAAAPSLPLPYRALTQRGVRIRPGQTSLTVAAPGAGKSQFWANVAQRMGIPTLFWSADTDQADVTCRTIAMWLGIEATTVERNIVDPGWRKHYFERLEGRADHIEWVFDSAITPVGAAERANAFAEVHGDYPALIVIDNLSNAIGDSEKEYSEVKKVMVAAQLLARETRAHVAVLHHATGAYEDGTKPIPQGGASQNPFKVVELGLTMWRPYPTTLAIGIVKNRGGDSDPGAKNPVLLEADFARATVGGWSQ